MEYDKYEVKDGMCTIQEYGYIPGDSVTENPLEVCRIVRVTADPVSVKEAGEKLDEMYESSRQYIEDCTKEVYFSRVKELKKTCKIVKSYLEIEDGEYLILNNGI